MSESAYKSHFPCITNDLTSYFQSKIKETVLSCLMFVTKEELVSRITGGYWGSQQTGSQRLIKLILD